MELVEMCFLVALGFASKMAFDAAFGALRLQKLTRQVRTIIARQQLKRAQAERAKQPKEMCLVSTQAGEVSVSFWISKTGTGEPFDARHHKSTDHYVYRSESGEGEITTAGNLFRLMHYPAPVANRVARIKTRAIHPPTDVSRVPAPELDEEELDSLAAEYELTDQK